MSRETMAEKWKPAISCTLRRSLSCPLAQAGGGRVRQPALEGIREGWVWAERSWLQATEDTGVGNPARSSDEKGKRFLKALTEKLAGFLVALSAQSLDELYEP